MPLWILTPGFFDLRFYTILGTLDTLDTLGILGILGIFSLAI
jgi:hypothetical protein